MAHPDKALATKLQEYTLPESTVKLIRGTDILFLVGFTGAGKDAIKQKLLETGDYRHIVSHTTRAPRVNRGVMEQDGVEYHFIDLATAEKMLDQHAYIEAKMYSGNVYGTSVAEIKAAHDEHKIAITDIEVQGVAEYMTISPEIKAAFILPPSFDVWQQRLEKRYGDSFDVVDYQRRMETALVELDELFAKPYYTCIINDNLDDAVAEIHALAKFGQRDVYKETLARNLAEKLYQDTKDHLAKL